MVGGPQENENYGRNINVFEIRSSISAHMLTEIWISALLFSALKTNPECLENNQIAKMQTGALLGRKFKMNHIS